MPISPSNRPTVLLTAGDSHGIGPEVILRALSRRSIRRLAKFLIIGDLNCLKRVKRSLKISLPLKEISLWELINSKKIIFDKKAISVLDLGGEDRDKAPLRYINSAVMLMNKGRASALVTAPVNKESIARSGIKFSGHTEYLAGLTGTGKIAMLFISGRLRTAVVTRHIPLKDVARVLTKEKIIETAVLTCNFLKDKFNIKRPKIGVCALNPHAGEGGVLGREERRIILPAIKNLKKKIPAISGPLPADSAFNLLYNGRFDGLIAMYHDQAMIPIKMVGRECCVNVTLGLPFVRTSPAHGTAYDIAGRGIADPSGMMEAIRVACRLIPNTNRHE